MNPWSFVEGANNRNGRTRLVVVRLIRAMKVTGKPGPTSVFVCIFGGLFAGIPAALGVSVVVENRRKRGPGCVQMS